MIHISISQYIRKCSKPISNTLNLFDFVNVVCLFDDAKANKFKIELMLKVVSHYIELGLVCYSITKNNINSNKC